jgi:hypothetical protein
VEEIIFDTSKDLNQLSEDLRQELGFDLPRPTQCSITPSPWSDKQEIRITTQETELYDTATKEAFRRRSFSIELEGEIWQSGEILSPWAASRDQVWAQLRFSKGLPDLSHFKIVQGNLDISGSQIWPGGAIEMIAMLYKIYFRVEQISGEPRDYIYPNITPRHMVNQVWEYLQGENPELRREFILDQTGFTHSGQVITAKIQTMKAWQNQSFPVIHKRWIRYENR